MYNMKFQTMIVLPGGGSCAIHFTMGILKMFHLSKRLIINGEFNEKLLILGTSGGTVPMFLILTVLWLGLHRTHENWFELFVETPINKINASNLAATYIYTQFQANLMDNPYSSLFGENTLREKIDAIVDTLLPEEFKNKVGFDFKNNHLKYNFRFHYFIDTKGVPVLTADNDDLSLLTIKEQIKQIIASCCTINGKSIIRPRQNFDAGTHVNNVVSCIDGYMSNIYLRDILYGGLYEYEYYSYNQIAFKFTLNYLARDKFASNCSYIAQFKAKCLRKGKSFHFIMPPTKYNPILKFDVPLYNKLQYKMSLEDDFIPAEMFLGFYLFRKDADISLFMKVVGMYETFYAFKQINKLRDEGRKDFLNINYKYISKFGYKDGKIVTNSNIDSVTNIFNCYNDIEKLIEAIKTHKTTKGKLFIEKCFVKYNGDISKSGKILKQYLFSMSNRPHNESLDATYERLFPANYQSKMFKNPRKYLNSSEKRISDNCFEIYTPNPFH